MLWCWNENLLSSHKPWNKAFPSTGIKQNASWAFKNTEVIAQLLGSLVIGHIVSAKTFNPKHNACHKFSEIQFHFIHFPEGSIHNLYQCLHDVI